MTSYTPDQALEDVSAWIRRIETTIDTLNASSASSRPTRPRAWKRTLEAFQKPPSLTVAFLGADVVPTSGGRACTSVITEISYHDKAESSAQIHFLTQEEWSQEIRVRVGDIQDDDNEQKTKKPSSRRPLSEAQARKPASEAAKRSLETVRIVYYRNSTSFKFDLPPSSNARQLEAVYSNSTKQEILANCLENVDFLLDAEKWPALRNLGTICNIAPSKPSDLLSELRQWVGDKGPWPLVRKVTVRCHSAALSAGVTLVDLPGLGDSNRARTAVAEDYRKNADHFFVVIPMMRAVDSTLTKELLGMSKAQLQITKCDDLVYDEVVASYRLEEDDKFVELRDKELQTSLSRQIAKADEDRAFQGRKEYENAVTVSTSSCPKTEEIPAKRSLFDEVESVSAPAKRPRLSETDDGAVTHEESHPVEYDIFRELNEKRKITKHYEEEHRNARYAMKAYCSQRRSQDTVDRLLDKFMEEMDDPDAESDDQGRHLLYHPEFPVFPVSARDYSKIGKRMAGEVACFQSIVDTQIPALQDHCRALPLRARQEFARLAFAAFKKITCSMSQFLETFEKDKEDCRSLAANWGSNQTLEWRLVQRFEDSHVKTVEKLKSHFKEGLEDKCASAAQLAISEAPGIAEQIVEDLKWQRLRATFRRYGAYLDLDINGDFAAPFIASILDSWRATLDKDVFPEIKDQLQKIVRDVLGQVTDSCGSRSFKRVVESRGESAFQMASSDLNELHLRVKLQLNRDQKTTSRSITTHVQDKLEECYEGALQIQGKGSVGLQKDYFIDFIDANKGTMFEDLTQFILGGLDKLAQSAGVTIRKCLAAVAEKARASLQSSVYT
ncbi:hypothetical protein FPV67DRAFT_1670264 [Lyophyllum atratum]|nr:hypothetical protein FPV67DRAFT_1670264 [Lyophyllum atratum]